MSDSSKIRMYVQRGTDGEAAHHFDLRDLVTISIKSPQGTLAFEAYVDELGWGYGDGRGLESVTVSARASSVARWTPEPQRLTSENENLARALNDARKIPLSQLVQALDDQQMLYGDDKNVVDGEIIDIVFALRDMGFEINVPPEMEP